MAYEFERKQQVAVLGGGPGGYEAAITAAQLGAEVTIVERSGIGGSAVLTDVVPSKTLIATAEAMAAIKNADHLGVTISPTGDADEERHEEEPRVFANLGDVNERLIKLARQQSEDMAATLRDAGVRIITGSGRLEKNGITVTPSSTSEESSGETEHVEADTIVVSVGARPRILGSATPDGKRILTWTQLYGLTEIPEHLIVVGSGVTGAEFASAYQTLGSQVTLVSSRTQVLPGEDEDAARVIEQVFTDSGMTVLSQSRAQNVSAHEKGVTVTLADGRAIEGTHCLMAVGSVPNTADIGLDEAGVQVTSSGHIRVNRVARTSIPNIYAAGDCTTSVPLASVASMQGRMAVYHAMGDAVSPIETRNVTSNIFTQPQIATVGWSQKQVEEGVIHGDIYKLPLESNPRAKMMDIHEGFVKLLTRMGSGAVIGAVIVAPNASELIFPLAIAVEHRLTVDQIANAFTVYPSLTASISDAARAMHVVP